MLKVKRVFDDYSEEDGFRILVERQWAGVAHEKVDLWAKGLAPSDELLTAFGNKEEKFGWFKAEYEKELQKNPETEGFVKQVKYLLSNDKRNVTFLYEAVDHNINQACVLRDFFVKSSNAQVAKEHLDR